MCCYKQITKLPQSYAPRLCGSIVICWYYVSKSDKKQVWKKLLCPRQSWLNYGLPKDKQTKIKCGGMEFLASTKGQKLEMTYWKFWMDNKIANKKAYTYRSVCCSALPLVMTSLCLFRGFRRCCCCAGCAHPLGCLKSLLFVLCGRNKQTYKPFFFLKSLDT